MKKLLVILFLLILPTALALNPKDINSADITYSSTGTLATSGNVQYINLKLYAYPKSDYQNTISSFTTEPIANRKYDTRYYYYYTWDGDFIKRDRDSTKQILSESQFDYTFLANIKSRFILPELTKKQNFPYTGLEPHIKEYTKYTDTIDINDNIRQKANEIASGEDDAFKVAFKLADYVSSSMTYDKSFLEITNKASWVMSNKKGVCDEYTVLFMSLCRSLGIPVRYVSGVAYSNIDNDFVSHSWAEVWFPDIEWVPFDPTYEEYGWVDVTHLKMQETADSAVTSIKYTWKGGSVSGNAPDLKVDISKKEIGLTNLLKSNLWVEEEIIDFGSYNIVWLELENPTYNYIATEAMLIKTLEIVGDNQQSVLIEPKSTAKVHWIIKVPQDLSSEYHYTYSIESNTLFAPSNELSFKSDPNGKFIALDDINDELKVSETKKLAKPDILVDIAYPEEAYIGELFEIKVNIANHGNDPVPSLKICVEEDCKSKYLGIAQEIIEIFEVTRDIPGYNDIELTFSGQGVDEFSQRITVAVRAKTFLDDLINWFENLFK